MYFGDGGNRQEKKSCLCPSFIFIYCQAHASLMILACWLSFCCRLPESLPARCKAAPAPSKTLGPLWAPLKAKGEAEGPLHGGEHATNLSLQTGSRPLQRSWKKMQPSWVRFQVTPLFWGLVFVCLFICLLFWQGGKAAKRTPVLQWEERHHKHFQALQCQNLILALNPSARFCFLPVDSLLARCKSDKAAKGPSLFLLDFLASLASNQTETQGGLHLHHPRCLFWVFTSWP